MKLGFSIGTVALLLVSVYLSYQYILARDQEKVNFRSFFKPAYAKWPLLLCLATAVVSITVFAGYYILGTETYLRSLMNCMVLVWLAVLSYVDLKEKIIPNHMILLGIGFWVLLSLLEIFLGGTHWKVILTFSLTGGLVCGGVLLVIALIGKSALGMGDVKMITVLGLLYGLMDTYSLLLLSMVVMAVVSVTLLLMKKVSKKTAIPMAPFVAIGFLLSIFAGL